MTQSHRGESIVLASNNPGKVRDADQYLGRAEDQLERAKCLMRQLLSFSHGGKIERHPVDLRAVLGESASLLGFGGRWTVEVRTPDDQRRAGEALLALGARAVLMKGGHLHGERVTDLLLTPQGETLFESARLETRHTHGTGCTLASACAAGLAQGLTLEAAVARAWAYVQEAIARAPGLGRGHGPLDHAWTMRGRA
jgi:hypothetical protein